MKKFYPVSEPVLNGNEKKYVLDCLESNWISSQGKYIGLFEEEFAKYCNAKHAISCCNGTAALHLALIACGISEGDEVIVPTFTFVSTANAVLYCNAIPVFADSDFRTWNIDIDAIEKLITKKTKAIIAVHIYGFPVNMVPILRLGKKYNLKIIEDAAEAHGAKYKGKKVGCIGDMGIFSFYGNKIITTGEGGMIVTNDDLMNEKIRLIKEQGMSKQKRYWFEELGYNYRMTNIAAAIGLAQLEKIELHLNRRKEINECYKTNLKNVNVSYQESIPDSNPVYWMNNIIFNKKNINVELLRKYLLENSIDTRPLFYAIHTLPYFKKYNNLFDSNAEQLASKGFTLPTYANLKNKDIKYICQKIESYIGNSN